MKVIIIGNGPGGNSVASKLDKAGCEVELYTDEAVGFYSRLRLPNCLGNLDKLEQLCSKQDPPYLHHCSVVGIHKEEKVVLLSTGEISSYDKLVIATGSNARSFFASSRLSGIFTLRTYNDGVKITNKLEGPVAVLGGGLLGLEAALAINKLGFSVTVIQGGDYVLSAQLNEEASIMVSKKCRERDNFNIICGKMASSVEGNGNIERIILENGVKIDCKTLLIAAGVIPSTSLAKGCGLKIERAIVVDSKCKTSDENIYAIGDCAQYEGACPGLLPIALTQAIVAVGAILDQDVTYFPPTLMPTRFVADDMDIACFGVRKGECLSKRVLDRYEAWYIEDNKVAGVILVGSKIHLPLAKTSLGKEVENRDLLLDF